MANNYGASGSGTLVAGDTAMSLISASTVRPALYEIIVGSSATPADQAAEFGLNRFTADGTGTAANVVPLDPASPTAECTAKHTYTAEPTVTAGTTMLAFAVNQRATFRWVAAPGAEILAPATTGNGLALRCDVLTSGYDAVSTFHWQE